MNGYQIASVVMVAAAVAIYSIGIIAYSQADKDTNWTGEPWVWIVLIAGILLMVGAVIVISIGYAKYT